MDYDLLKIGATVINMVVNIGLFIFALSIKKSQATTQSIKDLETAVNKKLEDKCLRISRVEADISSIPRRDELIRLHQRIDGVIECGNTTNLLIGQLLGQIKQMNNKQASE